MTFELETREVLKYLVFLYPVIHIGFGILIHRIALREYQDQVSGVDLSALFFHRLVYGLPHRVIMALVIMPLMVITYLLVNGLSHLAINKKAINWPKNAKYLGYYPAKIVQGEGGALWVWNGIIAIGVALDIAFGWSAFIPLTIIYIVACLVAYCPFLLSIKK